MVQQRKIGAGFKPRHGNHAAPFWDHVTWAEKNHRLLFLFLRYPRLGRGGRKDCAFVGILKDFGI